MKVIKGDLEAEVKAKYPKGDKAANWRAVMSTLNTIGAITKLPRTKLVAKKKEA
jgi:hypothetical protein